MEYFVPHGSIVRKIWGKSDTILFVFGGASAEFALNKAVDWLYFTGRLPADPLGRLFSTVMYARLIVFSGTEQALRAIDKITAIHVAVENNRGAKIPDWAYRDVLFMLIHYSIASFELLERKLKDEEKQELFDVFYRMGTRMGLTELPLNYTDWLVSRRLHLDQDLVKSGYTDDLYKQYRKHLGGFRFFILKESQKLVCPPIVKKMLNIDSFSWASPLLALYKLGRVVRLDGAIKALLLPAKYKKEIKALDGDLGGS
jgi:ER-bound oxygenase mpaB/B'/Rubber oxygenase, catalytic domain